MKQILITILLLACTSAGYANQEISVKLPRGEPMEFVWIEPGTFTMGSTQEQEQQLRGTGEWIGWFANEQPAHQVTISRGFWLGKYEIEQRHWKAVMETNPSYSKGENRPVDGISWDDVQEFIYLLNVEADETLYRLPSEAEWEYACRAGTSGLWSFGNDASLLGDYAWYYDNNSPSGTKEIGTKLPNPWGLYDMYGNVWEWCQDKWGEGYYASSPDIDPTGPTTGLDRVIRGGHFFGFARGVRPAVRDFYARDARLYTLGARLLKIGPEPTAVAAESWGRIKTESQPDRPDR
jgi:formylglycine-generating enzyme required for sulfatase activity